MSNLVAPCLENTVRTPLHCAALHKKSRFCTVHGRTVQPSRLTIRHIKRAKLPAVVCGRQYCMSGTASCSVNTATSQLQYCTVRMHYCKCHVTPDTLVGNTETLLYVQHQSAVCLPEQNPFERRRTSRREPIGSLHGNGADHPGQSLVVEPQVRNLHGAA